MKKTTKFILLALILFLGAGLSAAVFLAQKHADSEVISGAGTSDNADKPVTVLTHNAVDYPLKRRTDILLVIGTDGTEDKNTNSEIEAFYNYDLADFLTVLVFDNDAKTVTPLQLNRDTMCAVPWLSVNGFVGGHVTQQITYAHTYGTGKNDSCVNTRNAVSDLLYGAPIDSYIAFTMDAVPVINDLVGGVPVKLESDYPALGEEYVKGAEIVLKGKDALRFVRQRDIMLLESNLLRMERQRIYLSAFTQAAREAVKGNEDLAVDAFKAVDRFLCTDLTANDISSLVDKLCEYEILPVLSPEGELLLGDHAEFYVDTESLWDCVQKAFCRE